MRNRDSDSSSFYFIPPDPRVLTRMRRSNLIVMALLAFFVLGMFALAMVPSSAATKVPLKVDSNPPPVNLADFKNGYAKAIDPALPAVVNISSTRIVKRLDNAPNPFFSDPLFRRFFGEDFNQQQAAPQNEREHSLGSGVIMNSDGYILTNNHVVEGAADIEVFTQDKRKFRAKVVGTDRRTDVAVLKIDATGLPFVTLADSSNLKVGDIVFAIGDPFGVGETATMGIVSATGRGFGGAIEHYEDFIQTDAAINPGNSGGALLDLHGDLVGINTAIITGDGGGGNQGVGFAIPINMARNVMEQIVDHGKVVRGQLGVAIQNVDADMGKAFGLQQGGGALVADVIPGSPAAKAGIERGDIILELNGRPVRQPDDLSVRISQTLPGTTVHLKIARQGQRRDVSVTLGEMTETAEDAVPGESSGTTLEGVKVQNLTPKVARALGVPSITTGAVITSIDSSSVAAAAGLAEGDVILEIGRKPIANVTDYNRVLAASDHEPILLLIRRGEATRFVVVERR